MSSPSFLIVLGCVIVASSVFGQNVDECIKTCMDAEKEKQIQDEIAYWAKQHAMTWKRLTQDQKECLGGDETTGYCIPHYKPCKCTDESLIDQIVEMIPWINHCERQLSSAKFICVPGYEKCLKQDDPHMCLPSFEKKSDECEDSVWNKLYEKLMDGMKNRWTEPAVFPCMDFEEPHAPKVSK